MKNTLFLFILTFAYMQSLQSQTTQDLIGVGSSIFGSSKKQKKKDREQFVIDSTNNAIIAKKKRDLFVKDSLLNVEKLNRQKEEIKAKELAEKKKQEWSYDHYKENPYSFTFNKTIVGYFVGENMGSETIEMSIFSDSTSTTKVGSIKLMEILPSEVFDVLAYNTYNRLYLIKSTKDNKICIIEEEVMSYQNWGKGNGATLTVKYINPQVTAQKKLALENYRVKLKNALSTVLKLEAIHGKHTYNETNQFGTVVGKVYKVEEFSPQEKITYKQLILKLEKQKNSLDENLAKKIGNKETVRGLLENIDIKKQLQVEHAYTDYSYYALEW